MPEINEILEKKIVKITLFVLVFMAVVMLIFNFGLDFYNKVRCNSRETVNRMVDYCESRGMELRDMKFEDGMCISICGR
jgi:hypothetical protein